MNLATLTLAETRPVVGLTLLVLSMVTTGWTAYAAVRSGGVIHVHWRHDFRLSGWLPYAITASIILIVLVTTDPDTEAGRGMLPFAGDRLVETMIPLAIAIQAALLFAPDDEPSLELLLTSPKPTSMLLLERYLVVLLGQGTIALVAALSTVVLGMEDNLLLALLRWIPPALVLSGLAVNASIRSRKAAFGMMSVAVIWFVVAFFHHAFLPGTPTFFPLNYLQPWLWSVHIYLQPADLAPADYLMNRIFVLVLGLMLLGLALNYVRDTERLLLGKSAEVKREIK